MTDLVAAQLHLSHDPIMSSLIEQHSIKEYWGGQANYFLDLIEIITGQQLSLKAADTIFRRFLALFATPPHPQQILDLSPDKLRSIGLSNSKANYVQNLARAIQEGSLNPDSFPDLSDEAIVTQITAVKGLGPWSAEMFLIFSLKRPDIFSIGDLGIRTAMSRLYGVSRDDHSVLLKLSQPWQPYRTYACRYLWASLEK